MKQQRADGHAQTRFDGVDALNLRLQDSLDLIETRSQLFELVVRVGDHD